MAIKAFHAAPPLFVRLARTPGMPLAVAVALIPLLVFGFLRGGLFVAHTHGDQTTHLHAVSPVSSAKLVAGERCEEVRHDHSHASCESGGSGGVNGHHTDVSDCNHAPEGVLVSLAQPKQLPPRTADVSKTLHQLSFAVVVAILPTPHVETIPVETPDATNPCKPRDFLTLGASLHLVRTSHALLL